MDYSNGELGQGNNITSHLLMLGDSLPPINLGSGKTALAGKYLHLAFSLSHFILISERISLRWCCTYMRVTQ